MSDLAGFPSKPKTGTGIVTGADDLTSTPANTVLIATAGAKGAELSGVTAIPRATVTASALHLFISRNGGTTKEPLKSALMEAHTVAATTAIPETDFGYSVEKTLLLGPNEELYLGSAVALAAGIVGTAQWADL